jgi:hypothetical protein
LRNWAKLRGDILTTEQVSFTPVTLLLELMLLYSGLYSREGGFTLFADFPDI